jgi:hypothetical protein
VPGIYLYWIRKPELLFSLTQHWNRK